MGASAVRRLPDVPTMEEIGIPEWTFRSGTGCGRPKGTPKDIVDKLNAAVVSASPIRGCRSASPSSAMTIPPRDQADAGGAARPGTRPRSTSGGRSSSRTASRFSDAVRACADDANKSACDSSCRVRRHHGCASAELSVEAGHHDRAVPGRRRLRHPGARRGRGHEEIARPAGDRRECRRRRRHHRHRAGRALAGRTATPSASVNGPRMSAPARCFR